VIKKLLPLVIILLSTALIFMALKNLSLDVSLSSWGNNYPGYTEATKMQQNSTKPIALYFYTDWCSNCKALREQVLASAEITSYMNNLHAVKINPEIGINEENLAKKFGVFGYPSFFIIMENGSVIKQIRRTANVTPEQFIAQLQQATKS